MPEGCTGCNINQSLTPDLKFTANIKNEAENQIKPASLCLIPSSEMRKKCVQPKFNGFWNLSQKWSECRHFDLNLGLR